MSIRNIAICKIEKDNHIFVLEGYDPKKDEIFYRPIGGGIEFGELAKEAAVREFQEELGTNIIVDNDVQVFENIFEYNGKPGHEVVFILDAKFADPAYYKSREFIGNEGGNKFKALWVHINEFTSGQKILYPEGFVSSLEKSHKTL